MDIGSIFLILALLLLVAMFVARPFFERQPQTQSQALSEAEDHELSHLLAERDRLLNALQELDFDYALDKIPEGDYPAQRASLLQRGAEVLRQLDAIQQTDAGSAEERIEATIAARRAGLRQKAAGSNGSTTPAVAAAVAAAADEDIEVLLANRRRSRQGRAGGFCPQCGGPLQQSDRFCPKCGAPVSASE